MNEQDFKDALHRTMTVQQTPPPMSDVAVLDAARRDRTRRRTVLAAAGSVAAVVAVVAGAVGVGGVGGVAPPGEDLEAAQPPPSEPLNSVELADGLVNELKAVLPPGYEANYGMFGDYMEVGGQRIQVGVINGSDVGRLLIQLELPNGELREGCELAENQPDNIDGECTEIVVDGKRVGVITAQEGGNQQFDQWAAYRYDDGTTVAIAQSTVVPFSDHPPLAGPVFTTEQLAALAADPRFHLN